MNKLRIVLIIMVFAGYQSVMAQAAPDWSKFKSLIGHWVGEGNGQGNHLHQCGIAEHAEVPLIL